MKAFIIEFGVKGRKIYTQKFLFNGSSLLCVFKNKEDAKKELKIYRVEHPEVSWRVREVMIE